MKNYRSFYHNSLENPETFWRSQAEELDWFKFPREILSERTDGYWDWFKEGKLNTCYLAVDRHVNTGRGKQLALVYDSPVTGTKENYTYEDLLDKVEHTAGMLKGLGVKKGDRVVIYMPMIPQTVFAMLACARIGAVHSVVFGGFAPHELAIRIDDAEPKVILTASCGIEINKVIPYKPLIDAALEDAEHPVEHVVVFQREQLEAELIEPRDKDWERLCQAADPVGYEIVDANDLLYIIYTSGTTGKPKGVMRDHGGHAVALEFSMKYIYGIKPGEVFWAASDVGWVVGHSYIVYAPLIHGCTTILFEGKPVKTPDASTFWRVMDENKVNVFFTAPTAIRAMIKEDPEALLKKPYHLNSLRYMFLAGERCDGGTLNWLQNTLDIPVIDHWWQTESGWPMVANMPGIELLPIIEGSAGVPVPGYDMKVFDAEGIPLDSNEEGALAIKLPLPPGNLTGLWQNPDRFEAAYFKNIHGYYYTGDSAYISDDGHIFITGRVDDIINVAGHRLSTATIEEVVASHSEVAECAVIGVADILKGQIPMGFVVLKEGITKDPVEIQDELYKDVRAKVGPIASFKNCLIVDRLPKTRSGKILRQTMRSIADGKPYKVPSTIEDPVVLEEIERDLDTNWKSKMMAV